MPMAATNAPGSNQAPSNTGVAERVAVTSRSAPRTAASGVVKTTGQSALRAASCEAQEKAKKSLGGRLCAIRSPLAPRLAKMSHSTQLSRFTSCTNT